MLRLAWRNIWRNRRRSGLTVGSIGFGLAAVMMGQSMMKSIQAQMIEKSTGVTTGHLQVQSILTRDHKLPDHLLKESKDLETVWRMDPRVAEVSSRLLYTGLVSSAQGSRGIMITGVEPKTEERLSIIPSYIKEGRYFGTGPRDVVLGSKLASDLDVRAGEKLVVMAQARNGEMNSELFRVAGIFHSGSEQYDEQVVYIPLEAAQRIRGEEDKISYLVIRLKDFGETEAVQADFEARAQARGGTTLNYKQVGLEIIGIQKFEDAILAMVLWVIFLIVGLGVLNTISMSLLERLREFGVVRAIGARPWLIARLLVTESMIMGIIGIAAGLGFGFGMITYFGTYGLKLPIGQALSYWLPFDAFVYLKPFWGMHLRSACEITAVALLAAVAPAIRATRIRVSEALRHV